MTGASEGIGREFALQLADKGFNVLVSARNATALSALETEIGRNTLCCMATHAEYFCLTESKTSASGRNVQTKSVVMDFSKLEDKDAWARFETEVTKLDVGVLSECFMGRVGTSRTNMGEYS